MSYGSTRLLYGAHSIKVNKVALRQAFSPTLLPLSSVTIIPPILNTLIHFPIIDGIIQPRIATRTWFTKSCVIDPKLPT